MAMRFQIKKLLEGYDPADLMEQSMYCFGSSESDESDESVEAQERSDEFGIGQDTSQSQGFASPEAQASYNAQQTALANAIAQNQQLGAGLNNVTAQDMGFNIGNTLSKQDFAREQAFFDNNPMSTMVDAPYTSRMADINVGAGDIFGLKNQIANQLARGGKAVFNKDGTIGGVIGDARYSSPMSMLPSFLKGVFPNNQVYTGRSDIDPFNNEDELNSESSSEIVAPTTNPVSGQPVCPDGYRFDNDLQACRLDTARPSMTNNPNPFPSGDAFYRASSLDQAPMNVPSGFDFNNANQNFVNQFAYRPANFTNQMGLSGFTPFRRS